MRQAAASFLAGGVLSLLAFVPVMIRQYRRYGTPSARRMLA